MAKERPIRQKLLTPEIADYLTRLWKEFDYDDARDILKLYMNLVSIMTKADAEEMAKKVFMKYRKP